MKTKHQSLHMGQEWVFVIPWCQHKRKSSSRGSVFALIYVSLLFLLFGKILEDRHWLMLMIRKYTFFIWRSAQLMRRNQRILIEINRIDKTHWKLSRILQIQWWFCKLLSFLESWRSGFFKFYLRKLGSVMIE